MGGGGGGRWRSACHSYKQHPISLKLFGGHPPIQRHNTNQKKLTIEKLSKSGLRRCTKFGQAYSNNEQKITLSLILHFILDFRI